jgi:hypothetical protein
MESELGREDNSRKITSFTDLFLSRFVIIHTDSTLDWSLAGPIHDFLGSPEMLTTTVFSPGCSLSCGVDSNGKTDCEPRDTFIFSSDSERHSDGPWICSFGRGLSYGPLMYAETP